MDQEIAKVKMFMDAFGDTGLDKPGIPSLKTQALRYTLIEEEAKETLDAINNCDPVELADGLADLMYVVIGTAIAFGIPLKRVFDEVHRSNMTKLGGERDKITGKVLKPATYSPPDIKAILAEAGMHDR